MMAETVRTDKELLAEKIWLLYYNDVLYRDGIITADAYRKMIHKINSRTKTMDEQQKSSFGWIEFHNRKGG